MNCLKLDVKFGWLIGLTAAGLTLTAQTILANSALAMLQAPGLLASFAALWTHLCAIKQPTVPRLVSASLLMALTILSILTGLSLCPQLL